MYVCLLDFHFTNNNIRGIKQKKALRHMNQATIENNSNNFKKKVQFTKFLP